MKKISIIVAIAQNYAIGKDNKLLWHLPDDLKRFKQLTTGNIVVMGKKTYESLPIKPLPNRTNIVITDIANETIPGCIMAYSIDDAINKLSNEKENFIMGGGMVYRQFLPLANKLYITWVKHSFEADTFFPQINFNNYTIIEENEYQADDKNPYNYSYIIYERKH